MKSYGFERSPADEATTELEEGLMDGWQALESYAQSSELMQPGDGALDHPTGFAQATAVRSASAGNLSVVPSSPAGATLKTVLDAGHCIRSLQIDYDDEVEHCAIHKNL